MELKEYLKHHIAFFDGGAGTELIKMGLQPGELPETWNILHPERVTELHLRYLRAGANIIETNTFGANSFHYEDDGEFSLENIIRAGVVCAKKAVELIREEDGGGIPRYIALDVGPLGHLLQPFGDLPFEEAYNIFSKIVRIGAEAGVDIIYPVTMGDTYEIKAAVLAAKENTSPPVFVTASFDERGRLLTGATPESFVAMLEGLRVDALGINCGLGPKEMQDIVSRLTAASSLPVITNPNAGLPQYQDGKAVYTVSPDEFADQMQTFLEHGVRMIGGCCGTNPDHIKALYDRYHDVKPIIAEKAVKTVISSRSRTVEIGHTPIVIGERLNPTGKAKLKNALRNRDFDYLIREAFAQIENGADVLDVNVGLPELNESEMMAAVINELQAVTDIPLQIDTADPDAMEQALRIYNGKAMINSVNGKEEVMEKVFPLVQKYGGVLVALPLDEEGIPATAEGRINIAKKIIEKAAEYSIPKTDIVLDGLAMAVSADQTSAVVALETIRKAKEELGLCTIFGVSNISFGLPVREKINTTFLAMALAHGLSCAIVNPNSEGIMDVIRAHGALSGVDNRCEKYIAYCESKQPAEAAAKPAESSGITLKEAVEKGMTKSAEEIAAELIKTREPLEIINNELVPALDHVGKGFEQGTVFLPKLLMSAEACAKAFEVLKTALNSRNESSSKGKIILATVKGDIHDIGKNIVKALLENFCYEVIDLGRDVAPEVIVEQAIKNDIKLVGLSALMTTTVPSMKETIEKLHQQVPQAKVMVGGAVLTQDYADMMQADFYCKDAMASVACADAYFGA